MQPPSGGLRDRVPQGTCNHMHVPSGGLHDRAPRGHATMQPCNPQAGGLHDRVPQGTYNHATPRGQQHLFNTKSSCGENPFACGENPL
eukprot:2113933-Amphidinium_carterae.1